MTEVPNHTVLHRIDPQRNMCRYYAITIQPNLLGGISLVRTWGRIGTAGRTKIELFDDEETAEFACDRLMRAKTSRGYIPYKTGSTR